MELIKPKAAHAMLQYILLINLEAYEKMAGAEGFEPTNAGSKDPCLTA